MLLSPQARAVTANHALPTITEDENIVPLSARRQAAPQSIDLSDVVDASGRRPSVTFTTTTGGIQVKEISPVSVPGRTGLSPPPLNNVMLAGHTPSRVPRPPTPPPRNMGMDGIEDTPTRHNTHLNNFLTRSHDSDEEKELKGPLHMPELPNQPEKGTFTFEALTKKLELVSKDPEVGKPGVFQQPSPGLASPVDEIVRGSSQGISPGNVSVYAHTSSNL